MWDLGISWQGESAFNTKQGIFYFDGFLINCLFFYIVLKNNFKAFYIEFILSLSFKI